MRILIAEYDEVLADGIILAMQQAGYAVDRVADGFAADTILKGEQPFDLFILDIQLPKLDGFSVLRNLRDRKQQVPVIILTARDHVEDRVKGLDLGADDYLTKAFNLLELEARSRALLRRGQSGTNPLLACGLLTFDSVERRAAIESKPLELTTRELGGLEALMLRVGRVISSLPCNEIVTRMDAGFI